MRVHFRDLFHDFSIKERYVLSTSCATFDYHSAQSVEAIQPRDYSVETISPLPPPPPPCLNTDSKSIASSDS